MNLTLMTKCGPIEYTGLSGEAVEEFVNDYRYGTDRVLVVPEGDPAMRDYVTRLDVTRVTTTVVDDTVPEDPTPEGDAVDGDASEESGLE